MAFWDSTLFGVVIGGMIASGTQLLVDLRAGRRETRAARATADEQWRALQIATIVDLQEQLEATAVTITAAVVQGSRDANAVLTPHGRVLMLTARLEDARLAADIRTWQQDMRNASATDTDGQAWGALGERRGALQDRLGEAIKQYHGH